MDLQGTPLVVRNIANEKKIDARIGTYNSLNIVYKRQNDVDSSQITLLGFDKATALVASGDSRGLLYLDTLSLSQVYT